MTKNVFVIGAGTGYDFEMPLGADLVRQIAEVLKNFSPSSPPSSRGGFGKCLYEWLRSVDRPYDQDVIDALMRLSRAIHFAKSIDTLINDASDPLVKDIGKIAISHVIAEAESRVPFLYPPNGTFYADGRRRSPLVEMNTFVEVRFNFRTSGREPIEHSFGSTWFTSFFRELRAGLSVDDFRRRLASTTIVNFNYDRLLEYFLLLAIRQYDGVSFETAQEWLAGMEHIHPYGVLAPTPTFVGDDQKGGVQVGMLETVDIAKAPTAIRTFDEGVDTQERELIEKALWKASEVVLLGYGFHRQNNDLIGWNPILKNKDVWGTAMGLSDARRSFIVSEIHNEYNHPQGEGSVRLEPLNCRELIDEFGEDFFPLTD